MNYFLIGSIIYVIGFILTLIFLKFHSEKIGIDYSNPNSDNIYQLFWNTKSSACTTFGLIWPLFWYILIAMTILLLIWFYITKPIFNQLKKFTNYIIK